MDLANHWKDWEDWENDYLRDNFKDLTDLKKIAVYLKRTEKAVDGQRYKLNIMIFGVGRPNHRKLWSKTEQSYLRENHNKVPMEQLVAYLGRNEDAIEKARLRFRILIKNNERKHKYLAGNLIRMQELIKLCEKEDTLYEYQSKPQLIDKYKKELRKLSGV